MQNYIKHVGVRTKPPAPAQTPQTKPLPGREKEMRRNHAGGFSFVLDKWNQLDRFLILGSETGTAYMTERDATKQNFENVKACIKEDGLAVVQRVVEVSVSGRAPKNDPALLVLALCMAAKDKAVQDAAFAAINDVARTGTHVLHLVAFAQSFRGWGRSMRDGFSQWYLNQSPKDLAYQVTKYPSRDGFAHSDVLALAHTHQRAMATLPVSVRPEMDMVLRYVTHGFKGLSDAKAQKAIRKALGGDVAEYLGTIEALKTMTPEAAALTIADKALPREVVPTEMLNHPVVWEALLESMPVMAMVRNLGNLTKHGVVAPLSNGAMKVIETLTNDEALQKSRIHPIQVLAAMMTYASGKGLKGSSTWTPVQPVVSALNRAFYSTFVNAPETTGDLIAIDISGSMFSSNCTGMEYLSCAAGAAAMALVTANRSKNYHILGYHEREVPLEIDPSMRLEKVVEHMQRYSRGCSTDCSIPMRYAKDHNLSVNTFVCYTDNETGSAGGYVGYYGSRTVRSHPSEAVKAYRKAVNPEARMVVVGMAVNNFTTADPQDAGMLDVVGFDAAAPAIIASFANGEF